MGGCVHLEVYNTLELWGGGGSILGPQGVSSLERYCILPVLEGPLFGALLYNM